MIKRDIYLMRLLAKNFNEEAVRRIGVDAVTLLDEFAENLLEELDYTQEASNIEAFLANFDGDPMVKIPAVYPELCSEKVLCVSASTSDVHPMYVEYTSNIRLIYVQETF